MFASLFFFYNNFTKVIQKYDSRLFFVKAHLERAKNKQCNSGMMVCFSGMLYNLERTADNCVSIAEEYDFPGN